VFELIKIYGVPWETLYKPEPQNIFLRWAVKHEFKKEKVSNAAFYKLVMDWWANIDSTQTERAYETLNTIMSLKLLEKVRDLIYQYCGNWNSNFKVQDQNGEILLIDTILLVYQKNILTHQQNSVFLK
jgi:hypothetical protein